MNRDRPAQKKWSRRLRGILKLLNSALSGADTVGTLQAVRFLFLDNDTQW